MRKINPKVLQEVREAKGFSHTTLANASGINAKTIKRIESGKFPNNRDNVIKNLARALGTSESELTNSQYSPSKLKKLQQATNSANADNSEMEQKQENDDSNVILCQSQLNVRVSDRARNALILTANRYRVTSSQIVEIAPLLFCWAAEQSLLQRKKNIEAAAQKIEDLHSFQESQTSHLALPFSYRHEDIVLGEQKSINVSDIFGVLCNAGVYTEDLPEAHPCFDQERHNPFAAFLRELTKSLNQTDVPENTDTFESWDPNGSPNYNICQPLALQFVAGDMRAADHIIEGDVPLHKIPNELRGKDKGEQRAKWVHEEFEARNSAFEKFINSTNSSSSV